jgi:predicted MFS family arabinose efflux permease
MGFNFKKHKYALVLWIACTFFFAFQFIVRGSVGILREDIIQKFGIDTIAFGTLAGYYYLGYSGMQIPVGYMLDKFNFKFVAALSIVITALGTFTFTYADQWQYVLIGRFLIGAGSAAGFLSVAKVTKTFFPPKVHPMMIGFAFTFGLIGAVIGGKPTKMIFDNYGYDTTFNAIAVTALCISFIILSIRKEKELL